MKHLLGGAIMPHPPIILEEIGKGQRLKAAKTIEGMEAVSREIVERKPDTIIVITPHGNVFRDAISILTDEVLEGDFSGFGFENIKASYENNNKMVAEIMVESQRDNIELIPIDKRTANKFNLDNKLDHGTLVPLYFIDKFYREYQLVSITYGLMEMETLDGFGKVIKRVIENQSGKVIVIASGDLSHHLSNDGPYEYSPQGKVFDEKIRSIVENCQMDSIVDFDLQLANDAGECGLRSLAILMGVLKEETVTSKVFSYEGPFGVGYLTGFMEVDNG